MKLVESQYRSEETDVEVFSNGEIKNQDLIDLAKSGLVSGNIVSYSENSFMFETNKLMLPNFIDENFANGSVLTGIPIKHSSLNKDMKRTIVPIFEKIFYTEDKIAYIKNKFEIQEQIQKLSSAGRDNIVEILNSFFNSSNFLTKFELNISLLADKEDSVYFLISSRPKIDLANIFDNYIQAILHMNRLWRSKFGSEKLCFCPLETQLGEEISSIISLLNAISQEVRITAANDLIAVVEQLKGESFDEYMIEEVRTTGIEIEENIVSYFKNVCFPYGTSALIKDSSSGDLNLCYLNKTIKYLPTEMDLEQYKHIFKEIIPLKIISSL